MPVQLEIPDNIKIAMKKTKIKKLKKNLPFTPEQCKGIWLAWNYVAKKKFCKLLNLSLDRCNLLYKYMIKFSKGKELLDRDFKKISKDFK